MVGSSVAHYRVESRLASGGMGEVYLAEDALLRRKVALKFLKVTDSAHASARFVREAQAAGGLDHPNIVPIYEAGEWQGRRYIAMAYVPGESLQARLTRGPLSIAEAARLASQIASGLAAAHAAGIVHRDLKPGNVMVSDAGVARIVDFGLAKPVVESEDETTAAITSVGTTVGTLAYMSPEQALGQTVDHRTDIWALGVVLYEMLAGCRPFEEKSSPALLRAITAGEVRPLVAVRPEVPAILARLVARCLEREPDRRLDDAQVIVDELQPIVSGAAALPRSSTRRRRMQWAALAGVIVLIAGAVLWIPVREQLHRRAAVATDVPEIRRLAEREDFVQAFTLLQKVQPYLANDPILSELRQQVSTRVSIHTEPPGALVAYARYGDEDWRRLGDSPLDDVEVPRGLLRWKIEKPGFAAVEDAVVGLKVISARLVASAMAPAGMVRVLAPTPSMQTVINGVFHAGIVFDDFWLDRHEVTNREFAAFAARGGYRTRSYWQHPFVDSAGREIAWDEAMRRFQDRTGRPGPAGWVLGQYPAGEDDLPVTGISWFEAAAYAAFAGKHLPTVFQWQHVAGHNHLTTPVMTAANFGGAAVRPVGDNGALHRFGARDLAGNVKEWVFNASGPDARYLLGGAWDEPPYLFAWSDARTPWDRSLNVGFRCAQYDRIDERITALRQPIAPSRRDYSRERPVDDAVFQAYARAYAYDRGPVAASRESIDVTPPEWVRETVSFPAAYGDERVPVHIFLPKRATPRFQTVVFMPGAGSVDLRSSQNEVANPEMSFLVSSGRALVFPIYRGTYERPTRGYRGDTPRTSSAFRDHVVDTYKDLARTLDYLSTRPDIDMTRVAYLGASRGAALAPIYLALEPRFKTAVLYIAGFYGDRLPPEIDALNFAPRVRMPVLMLSGRFDFIFPEQALQVPFFEALGAPAAEKRRVIYDTGHNLPRMDMIKQTLAWLDDHLGPVVPQ